MQQPCGRSLRLRQNKPWGTNVQLRDSIDKLDISLADATALCRGINELNSNGNLTNTRQQLFETEHNNTIKKFNSNGKEKKNTL